eukprot:TRINITY_DN3150_c0_g1_i4.p1 TRINITY_DN3150_c0_g1~~TRINITY_DN3150_c0_g1_i4.p1  ORF type:complete len:682 (-),score=113.06 TRINITY_DN3150_c0_g1_i4:149-2194(-)
MKKLVTVLLIFSLGNYQTKGQKTSLLWREDGRCGEKFPLPTGNPGQCDPEGNGPKKGPCCSPKGFCGNTVKHCECATCVDYSLVPETKKESAKLDKQEKLTKLVKAWSSVNDSTNMNDSDMDTSETTTIQTRVGAIKGKRVDTDGFSHYHFFGIPYAQPPIGVLRFKAPLPVRPWRKTLEAYEKGPHCYQRSELFPPLASSVLSEDCLHLNIYTEDVKPTAKPVMIWIHGGGFTLGSGNDFAPLVSLLKEGVIVVTINYRLSSLGFMTFGNDVVSGNMGLKDQALAIQWVKQNIQNFGGNPDKITIFGESAGGISVHAQVLSPWNFGQIQGAIAQSGTMLVYNQIKSDGPREELFAQIAAEKLGCRNSAGNLDQGTLECLQMIDIEEIMEKLSGTGTDNYNNKAEFDWRPVVDNYASNPFLPLDPLEAMQTGVYNQIPFMSGTVKNDGAIFVSILKAKGSTTKQVQENWGSIGPKIISGLPTMNPTAEDFLFANITMNYYNHPAGESVLELDQPLMDLTSDVVFLSPDQKTVQLMSKHSQHVFNYYLTQKTDKSPIGQLLQLGIEYTPIHGDDLIFLMTNYGQKLELSQEESALSSHMIKYWTNFAKFGHPSPSSEDLPFWDSVTETDKSYMELKAVPEMSQDILSERMYYWEKMLWAPKQEDIERKVMYKKATQFLLNKN